MIYFLIFKYYNEAWLWGGFSNGFRLILYEDNEVLSIRDKFFKRLFEGTDDFKKVYYEWFILWWFDNFLGVLCYEVDVRGVFELVG